jgi:hypothetical protein
MLFARASKVYDEFIIGVHSIDWLLIGIECGDEVD